MFNSKIAEHVEVLSKPVLTQPEFLELSDLDLEQVTGGHSCNNNNNNNNNHGCNGCNGGHHHRHNNNNNNNNNN